MFLLEKVYFIRLHSLCAPALDKFLKILNSISPTLDTYMW
jgi:hypothetical protein